jgi:hypothetical protein
VAKPTITEHFPDVLSPALASGTLRLVASDTGDGIGQATASGEAVGGKRTMMLDADGWLRIKDGSVDGAPMILYPNEGSSEHVIDRPTGTVWELVLVLPGARKVTRYLDIPDSAGPYRVDEVETDPPEGIEDTDADGGSAGSDYDDIDGGTAFVTGDDYDGGSA